MEISDDFNMVSSQVNAFPEVAHDHLFADRMFSMMSFNDLNPT